MSKFIGKWVDDSSVPRANFAELLDKIDVSSEMKEKFLKSTGTYDYRMEGNKVTVAVTTTAFPDASRSYSFISGEPFDDVGMDGSPFKTTITITGDDTITETGKHGKYGDFEMVRKVEGDSLKCTQKMAGVTATFQMKRA